MKKSFWSSPASSFLRESGRIYLLYLSAGLAAVPAGALYAILAANGYKTWWTALLSIGVGLWCAREAWSYADRTFFLKELTPTASGATATWSMVPATAVAVVILSVPVPRYSSTLAPLASQRTTQVDTIVLLIAPEGEQFTEQCTEEPVLTHEGQV